MAQTTGIRWGRWAALAGGLVLLRGVVRGVSSALAAVGDEAVYRAFEAAERLGVGPRTR